MKKLTAFILVWAMASPLAASHCGNVVSRSRFVNRRANKVFVNKAVVEIPKQFVAVPVAIPVGLATYAQPISAAAPYYYAPTPYPASHGAYGQPAAAAAKTAAAPDRQLPASAATRDILNASCIKCHGAAAPTAGLDLTIPYQDQPADVRASVLLRILSTDPAKRMPKGQPALTAEHQRTLIRESVQ